MRFEPYDINRIMDLMRKQVFDPDLIPDGSAIMVHRPWSPTSPIMTTNSLVIRHWTDSWINHTAVKITRHGEPCFLDSGAKGVLPYSVPEWVKYHYPKYWVVIPPPITVPNEDWEKYLFRPYDYKSVYLYHPLYKITGKWYGKAGIAASEATYCTELWSHEMQLPDAHLLHSGNLVEMFYTDIQNLLKPV